MKLGIGIEIDHEVHDRGSDVHAFVDRLSEYIATRDYGPGVEYFAVGLIVIRSKLGYENWFKQRKPRFQKAQKMIIPGQPALELHNCFCYDIKLSNEEIDDFAASKESAIKLFGQRFLASLANFESPSMKKRNFDLQAFRKDVKDFVDSWEFE